MLLKKFFQNKNVFFLLLLAVIVGASGFLGFYLFTAPKQSELQKQGVVGEYILKDFSSQPIVSLSQAENNYQVKDTLRQGVTIQYANLTEEQKKEQEAMPKDELNIELPKNYQEPISVKLDEERMIQITDKSGDNFSDKLITEEIPLSMKHGAFNIEQKVNEQEKKEGENSDSKEGETDKPLNPEALNAENLNPPESQTQEVKYLKYQDKEKRKSVYYAYQKETETRKLKHWTIYNHPNKSQKEEKETYQINNAKLKLNDKGEVEVFYFGTQEIQNEEVKAEVEPSLMERAQRTLQKELGEDIMNSNNHTPDFVIPLPYYINKDQKKVDLKWEVNQEKNEVSIAFSPNEDEYPLALDPTLQFTAPGQNNSGDLITSNAVRNDEFGKSMISGDFNNDGKTDLAVSSTAYLSSTGRVYVFYNDNSIPTAAATADLIITGETTSDYFGSAMIGGDFNSDGKTDLAVGAYGYSSGRAYIFYNDGTIPTTAATADVIIDGESSGYFGSVMTSGDFDADGDIDLAIGAHTYSSNTGRAYIFYNDGLIPTTAATADVIITGEAMNSYFGVSMTSGDFNADGKTDLIVGAYGYTSNTGRAYIFYNDGSIPTTAATADVIITGESTSNYFGFYSMISGDFNNDGTTDLAVGAYGYTSNTGRAYIFYNDGSIPTTAATADVIITGEATSNYFGRSMAGGDFNNDGSLDLAVGANGHNSNTGRAYIFYNDGTIPTTAATADVIITGETTYGYFGTTMTSGDFNADGKMDLSVGAYRYLTDTGRAYIFYNDGGYPSEAINADMLISGDKDLDLFGRNMISGDFNADGKIDLVVESRGYGAYTGKISIFYNDGNYDTSSDGADLTILGEDAYNYFGRSMLAADFNNDNKTDLIVGASGYNSDMGRVYVFYNDGSIPIIAKSADVIITGESGSGFGSALAEGDFNNDRINDLVVGASGYSTNTGRAYIFYNDGSIPADAQNSDITITGGATNNYFGSSLVCGDFNNDSKIDLVVGAYGYNTNTGRAYIFYNDGSMPAAAATADVTISGEGGYDFFSYSMIMEDFNADGKYDLVVGAYEYSSDPGHVYIFYNDGSIPATVSLADVIITGESSSGFGYSMDVGDFNADGKKDLAVGAYRYNSVGGAYIFYNDGLIPNAVANADVLIIGEMPNNYFGSTMTSGDFDADGKTDLAVGAYVYSSGRTYIFYSQKGQVGLIDTIVDKNGKNNNFCSSMLAADFNNDGKTDLAVGVINTAYYFGRAYIFYNNGLISDTVGTADVIIVDEGSGMSDNFGRSLASGDFNSDGINDLVVGSYGRNKAYIFYCDGSIPTVASNADIIISGSSYFGSAMTSGDFDNDGKTDLAVGNNNNVYIFNNDGSIPTTSATADLIIAGEATNNYFGFYSMISGDFNNDGTTDLAVGAYGYTSNTGRAYIFYNDGSIPTTAATADVIITGEATSNYFGRSMAGGDFNNDGSLDLAVGADSHTSNTGRAYIFYNDGSIPTTAATADVTITGEATSNYFGYSMTSGDFNADGKTDLIVGAYGYLGSAGRAYIFYNDGSIPTTAATADVKITGDDSFSLFGATLSKGDLNSDGKDDLIVGAKNFSSGAGCVYVFYGDNDLPASTDIADLKIIGEGDNNYFGSSMTSGDFNADGRIDLAVGAIGYSANAGRAYIFYNDGSIPTRAVDADIKIDGEETSKFGSAMTSGDFNNDNRTDLAVSATSYATNTGRAYIFHNDGSISTMATTADAIVIGEGTYDYFAKVMISGDFNADGKTDLVLATDQYSAFNGRIYIFYNDGSIPTTAATADVIITGETLGTSIDSGDFNNDGRLDLVAGSYYAEKAYIFYNDGSYPATSSAADVIIDGFDPDARYFGSVLTAGDFNSDGKTDFAVAAGTLYSLVYIFYNDGSIPTAAATADVKIKGYGNYFGSSLISGDFNSDGRIDLGIGCSHLNADLTFYLYTVDAPGTKPNYIKTQGGVQFNGGVILQ